VAETGQQVKKGDPLLTLYAPDLVTTQREYLLAMENLRKVERSPFPEVVEGARRLLASARERLELWDITDVQIDRLEDTGKVERTLTLYSPFDGVVLDRHAVEGAYAKPGEPLLKLADLSRIWVLADVYETELPWVRPGTPAEMTLTYHPGQVYKGRLDYVYPTLDPKTRVVQARLIFDNADGSLKPGMYADVTLTPRVAAQVVAVPAEAVIHSGRRNIAFVALGNGRFEPRELTLGPEGDNGYQVLAGLSQGEQVVTSAQFLLDSESQLKEAIAKLLEARAKPAAKKPSEPPAPIAAGGPREGPGNEQPTGEMSMGTSAPARRDLGPVSDKDVKAWSDAFAAYLAIQSALASDTVKGVADQAEALMHALHDLMDHGVTGEQMRRVHAELTGMENGDLEVARGAFGRISQVMLELARGPGRAVAAKLALSAYHCPMSHANWLQQGQVANPYFGASMLRCGEPLGPEEAGRQ
jgi:Cu(I)/Ag(I) efflux system membrane fusion protein/cobalt-zinc-cadmium efflux system membrane fusion protein